MLLLREVLLAHTKAGICHKPQRRAGPFIYAAIRYAKGNKVTREILKKRAIGFQIERQREVIWTEAGAQRLWLEKYAQAGSIDARTRFN